MSSSDSSCRCLSVQNRSTPPRLPFLPSFLPLLPPSSPPWLRPLPLPALPQRSHPTAPMFQLNTRLCAPSHALLTDASFDEPSAISCVRCHHLPQLLQTTVLTSAMFLPCNSEISLSRRSSSASIPTVPSSLLMSAALGSVFPPIWRRRYAAM